MNPQKNRQSTLLALCCYDWSWVFCAYCSSYRDRVHEKWWWKMKNLEREKKENYNKKKGKQRKGCIIPRLNILTLKNCTQIKHLFQFPACLPLTFLRHIGPLRFGELILSFTDSSFHPRRYCQTLMWEKRRISTKPAYKTKNKKWQERSISAATVS